MNKASEGFLYPLGGFYFWGGDHVNTQEFKRRLTTMFSADVAGLNDLSTGLDYLFLNFLIVSGVYN